MSDILDRLAIALADRYEIVREIGEGGMATVYLARDVKHGRQVAIKVLRPELAARLGSQRFLQEIKVTAGLQHPNILPLYDSGGSDDLLFYVMPYVQGESLRARMKHEGQLNVEDTVAIARSIAAALDYAHEHGIVHRDIKPENVLLQRGQALVADFGIALAVSAAGGPRLTEIGMSLGTPHYMSPEQAGDRPMDARSDIYSMGAVTYEMLTGDPPHPGQLAPGGGRQDPVGAALPISQSRDLVPANVEAAVHRAIAKSPADRFTRASQFADALSNPGFRLPDYGGDPGHGGVVHRKPRGGSGPAAWRSSPSGSWPAGCSAAQREHVPLRPRRLGGVLPPAGFARCHSRISGAIARRHRAELSGRRRRLEPAVPARAHDPVPTPIPRTEGANSAFISADGQWVGFLADQSLKKVRLADGSDGIIAPYVEAMAGATWGEDDTILFSALPKGPCSGFRPRAAPRPAGHRGTAARLGFLLSALSPGRAGHPLQHRIHRRADRRARLRRPEMRKTFGRG